MASYNSYKYFDELHFQIATHKKKYYSNFFVLLAVVVCCRLFVCAFFVRDELSSRLHYHNLYYWSCQTNERKKRSSSALPKRHSQSDGRNAAFSAFFLLSFLFFCFRFVSSPVIIFIICITYWVLVRYTGISVCVFFFISFKLIH